MRNLVHEACRVVLENTKKEKRSFFFLSFKNEDGNTLTPRIPDCDYTRLDLEDNTTNRVCVSTRIAGSISGIAGNQDMTGAIFYVHEIVSDNWVKPTKDQVPDAHITDEYWVLEPVKPKKLYKIKVTKKIGEIKYTLKNGYVQVSCQFEYKKIS